MTLAILNFIKTLTANVFMNAIALILFTVRLLMRRMISRLASPLYSTNALLLIRKLFAELILARSERMIMTHAFSRATRARLATMSAIPNVELKAARSMDAARRLIMKACVSAEIRIAASHHLLALTNV